METIKTTNPYAEVVLAPVVVDGREIDRRAVLVRDDEGDMRTAAIVSPDYHLVTNTVARDVMADVASRSQRDWEELTVHWNGRNYIQMLRTAEPELTLPEDGGHRIHLGMMVRNSYDGSGAFAFELFALHSKCQNQYVNRNLFGFFALRHTVGDAGGWDVNDALARLSDGANNLLKIGPRLQKLMKEPLTVDGLLEARARVKLADAYWPAVLSELADQPRTRFGLFQALTSVISHKAGAFAGLRASDAVGSFFLN